jgi:uncharacterized protein YjbI with pentapeptide repeats
LTCEFADAIFSQQADFTGAVFCSVSVNFTGTTFFDRAFFAGAIFFNADFSGATLRWANFENATFFWGNFRGIM